MLAVERQNEIMNMLLDKKSVSIADLSKQFNVTYETIRRDLKTLESETGIERTYGGAVLQDPKSRNFSYENVSRFLKETKKALANKAISFLEESDRIFIDHSTTCFPIAQLLPDMPLSVVTNSIDVSSALVEKEKILLLLLGGFYDNESHGLFGRMTINNIQQFNVDKAFLSCRSISIKNGLSDKTEEESTLRSTVIKLSKKVFLLMDNTKFDWDAFIHTDGIEKITAVITDKPLEKRWSDYLKSLGIDILVEEGK